MSVEASLPVQIGEVKIGRAGQSLNAILGSCIGLGFLHRDKGLYGLAHCLLANSGGQQSNKGDGRHVDQAILTLLREMEISDKEKRRVQVFIAGGANMTLPAETEAKRLVGRVNADFARKALRDAKLRIMRDDTGGQNGRRVTINCTTGEFTIESIPRLGAH